MRMMAWSNQRNKYSCRYCLTPSPVFDMVGLQKNSRKKVRMLFCPFYVVGTQLEATYKWQMTGEGITYRA